MNETVAVSHYQPSDDAVVTNNNNSDYTLRCAKAAAFYQNKFRSIEAVRSMDLLHILEDSNNHDLRTQCIFVDVRTETEQSVSMIEGAVSLHEFEVNEADDILHQQLLQDKIVIVYCTIGYRSGLEATRLHQKYPHLKIFNLDGIVAYALAQSCDKSLPPLIVPDTGLPTRMVHTFLRNWDFLPDSKFQSIHFSRMAAPWRTLQVAWTAATRYAQTIVYKCNCTRSFHQQKDHFHKSHRY